MASQGTRGEGPRAMHRTRLRAAIRDAPAAPARHVAVGDLRLEPGDLVRLIGHVLLGTAFGLCTDRKGLRAEEIFSELDTQHQHWTGFEDLPAAVRFPLDATCDAVRGQMQPLATQPQMAGQRRAKAARWGGAGSGGESWQTTPNAHLTGATHASVRGRWAPPCGLRL